METKRKRKREINGIIRMLLMICMIASFMSCSKDEGVSTPDPINEPEQKSSEKQIISFRFTDIEKDGVTVDVSGQIDQAAKIIGAEMPPGTEISAMEPELEISDKASYEPTGPQDFSDPINYTVTAEDGTSRTYLVTVEMALSQKEILLLISQANANNTLDWDENDNISDWEEVVLDGDGKVVELQLALKSLTTLPPEIGQLINLEVLALSDNDLSALPPEIGQLVNLEVLILLNNDLSALPSEIGQLVNLKRLDLTANNLSALPKEIWLLVNLEVLYLAGNSLSDLPPEIEQLVNLERLDLAYNKLSALPQEIGQLVNLEVLYLHNNPDLGAIPVAVCNLDTSQGGNTEVDIVPGVACTGISSKL